MSSDDFLGFLYYSKCFLGNLAANSFISFLINYLSVFFLSANASGVNSSAKCYSANLTKFKDFA